jgi:branched-chain amino acid transport system ATP-binding protein
MAEILKVEQISKSFGGLRALHDVSFHVNEGELISIIGPNGAGKTTLFNMITGFHKVDRGRISFDGDEIANLGPHVIVQRGISRTFQTTILFGEASVLDNVTTSFRCRAEVGLWDAIFRTARHRREEKRSREKTEEILEFTGLASEKFHIAGSLSQGSQKRLSIAMALATSPKLMLLDEPSAGINFVELDDLVNLIKKIRQMGVTICLVEHKMKMVMSISDRLIVLDHGRKIAEGSPSEVTKNPQVIKAYLGNTVRGS